MTKSVNSSKGTTSVIRPDDMPKKLGRLTNDGREICSPVSRVVAAYLPTLGERIRRYTGSPILQSEIYQNQDNWDDENNDPYLSDDDDRVSVHEDRYREGLDNAKKVKSERDKKAKDEAVEKEKAEKEAFRKKVKAAIKGGETDLDELAGLVQQKISTKQSSKSVDNDSED
jgi:hypothetical protein